MGTPSTPLVSICTPTYNRPAFLAELIESIRAQEYENWEMFIADNSPDDRTERIVTSRPDPRIHYERNGSNIGMGRNALKVLSRVRGKYFTFTPDDDLWRPDNLRRKVAFLEANPDVPAVFSNANRISHDGRPLARFRSVYSDAAQRLPASVLSPSAGGSEYFVNILTGVLKTDAALDLFRQSWRMNTEEMFMWYLGLSGGEIGFDGAPLVTLREAEHYRVVEHKGRLIDFKQRADYRQRQLVDFYRVLHVQYPAVRTALEQAEVQRYISCAIVACARSYRDLARAIALVGGTFGATALRRVLCPAIGKGMRMTLPFIRRRVMDPSGLGPVEVAGSVHVRTATP